MKFTNALGIAIVAFSMNSTASAALATVGFSYVEGLDPLYNLPETWYLQYTFITTANTYEFIDLTYANTNLSDFIGADELYFRLDHVGGNSIFRLYDISTNALFNELTFFGEADFNNGVFETLYSGNGTLYDTLSYSYDAAGGIPIAIGGIFNHEYTRLSVGFDPYPVPVPAAVWLFGSGLFGLVSLSRRRRT